MALLKDSLVRRTDRQRAIVTATPDKPRFRPIAPLNEVLGEITSALTDKMNEHFARLSKISHMIWVRATTATSIVSVGIASLILTQI